MGKLEKWMVDFLEHGGDIHLAPHAFLDSAYHAIAAAIEEALEREPIEGKDESEENDD